MYYLFDGTFAGFLCCVFESFERREWNIIPQAGQTMHGDFFQRCRNIITDDAKAKRVLNALVEKSSRSKAMDFYRVFLSENKKAWQSSIKIITQIFQKGDYILNNYGDEDVLYFSQTLKKVSRERHRMKAFTRFKKSGDGIYFAIIEPDFNVLPLIAGFFKARYADQQWLIYDAKRKYGLFYNKSSLSEVMPVANEAMAATEISIPLDKDEIHYQQLWKSYFKSTNIEARKNMKLHLQHVPKRYWKHLTEKN